MNKSVIIVISIVWLMCTTYFTLGRYFDYPYKDYAMAGSWLASLLLLISIIIFIKKHRDNKKGGVK